ncbi:MAG: hypothetical protein AAGI30_08280 [Planctomycetota bacterium]
MIGTGVEHRVDLLAAHEVGPLLVGGDGRREAREGVLIDEPCSFGGPEELLGEPDGAPGRRLGETAFSERNAEAVRVVRRDLAEALVRTEVRDQVRAGALPDQDGAGLGVAPPGDVLVDEVGQADDRPALDQSGLHEAAAEVGADLGEPLIQLWRWRLADPLARDQFFDAGLHRFGVAFGDHAEPDGLAALVHGDELDHASSAGFEGHGGHVGSFVSESSSMPRARECASEVNHQPCCFCDWIQVCRSDAS